MTDNKCLLCNDAACTRACGKMEPDRILRSIYFDNEDVVRNSFKEEPSCVNCDAMCERSCPNGVDIRKIICSLYDPDSEKTTIDHSVLKTDFCGIPLENPFLISSSVASSTYDMCARAFEAGWAGVSFKTICLMDIEEASPRFSAIKGDDQRIIGFKNIEQLSTQKLSENLEIFRRLKDDYPDKFLMVSIMGRDDKEWAYLANMLNDSGADALELNFSCPNMTQDNTGSDVGQIPELVNRFTRIVREHSRLPIIVKLTPNVTRIEDSADAAIAGGADGVAAINTIKCLIDIDTNYADGLIDSSVGGYSGIAVRPIALRFISDLSKDKKLKGHHISAMGGIETWKDALDFIVLGADTVQVTTAVMQYGYRIIDDLKDGMALYLQKHDIPSVRSIKNSSISSIVPVERLDRSYIIYPKFIREKCVGCQRCYLSCRDGGHQAISIVNGKPVLDVRNCVVCHLCTLLCPKGAIVSSMNKVSKKDHEG
ncbi:MAG: NAD-dependent dihydropyrimidine dehydrogenase subunit PreA [Erysipelotrichaceae bacterium]|nr:NAD-dependent dihydropyrimidine dehydrogenase subunit PreA [Erysipelotrichaceae bacterium]